MLRNLSTSQKVAIAVAVPVSVALLYLLFKSRDEEFEYSNRPEKNLVIKHQTSLEIKVPREKVGAVIGREGCVINKIREATGARLKFMDHDKNEDGPRLLVITGKPSSALEAEQMVHKIVSSPVPLSVEFMVPVQAVGRILGKGGANVRSIIRASGAKIRIPREEESLEKDFRLCTIRGTPEEIATAKAMIEEEIALEEEKKQRLANASANRKQRNPDKAASSSAPLTVAQLEQVRFPAHGDFFTIYVSAVEHPNHFWMQIISTKASELDLMVEEMTEFYNQARNQESHTADSLCTGDIVASPFEHDTSWYRAKIVGFLEEGKVDLYFVDYGDYGAVPKENLCKLRADFLSLPFQAIECSLAGIESLDEKWPEEAIDVFDNLTYCAQWQPLMARMMGYERSGPKTLPCVDLVDTSSEEDVNVAAELVKRGYGRDTTVSSARKPTADTKMKPQSTLDS
ncbi:putative tudor and KH domain-containing protein [Apostichopus japonicus]|uniref:Putative tudor and KH domain-containing protein n=1 Tax=Stichopus japonicus TaxID=307972 RepID=A0A2G8L7Z9_STIJA|nr:putative tudor and KH domain-containing protein [Apostichopus japonicus]